MLPSSVVRHMSSVEDYRQRLAHLQGSWDTLSLLSHLSGDGTDIGATRQAFEALANDLVERLAEETHHKALLALKSKSQIAIDVLVRNLYERTADVGFLATDADIREFAHRHGAFEAEKELPRERERLRRRFREYVAKYSVYDDVVLLAPNGDVLARLEDETTVARCTDPLLDATLTSRAAYVETFAPSSLFPGAASKLIYSYRVVEDGQVDAVLCLCFKFNDEVARIFGKLREASDWTVFSFLDGAVPGAPAWYAGLLMYRGTPVSVVDLARFVGSDRQTSGRDIVIARTSNDTAPIGILIDELDDIPEVAASRILPITEFAQRGRPSVVDRAVRPREPDDPVLFIVNLDQLLMHARAFAQSLSPAVP